ncbi:MAG: cytochrome C [Hyphomicrobiales bacterium]|nr:cytochrome C [Hyphomicrobiales bacterium]
MEPWRTEGAQTQQVPSQQVPSPAVQSNQTTTSNKGDRLSIPAQNAGAESPAVITNNGGGQPVQQAVTQPPAPAPVPQAPAVVAQPQPTAPPVVEQAQTEAVDQIGAQLLATDQATGQSDDLLALSPEEQQAVFGQVQPGAAPAVSAPAPQAQPVQQAQPATAPAAPTGYAATAQPVVNGLSEEAIANGAGQVSYLAESVKSIKKSGDGDLPKISEAELELYPTAAQCGECHKQIYDEWRSSQHAYASVSPMFQKFEQRFTELTQGTVGTFCVRCHQQVGTQLGEGRETPLWERAAISREGISCITCHRVPEQYGKVNGERRVMPGTIFDPVYGSGENSVIKDILANKDTFSVKTTKDGRGNEIHNGMMTNPQITKSEFCVSCHQVAVNLGIKLEIVWDQYRDSPAKRAGITCQDCHMGKVPGKPQGYATAPSAVVGGKEINPGRRHANHAFIGPGYSIAHPGIFPHNKKAAAFSMKDWLQFDWRRGWGTPEFEDQVANGAIRVNFPQPWADALDREDARVVIEENLATLQERYELRRQVMENGSKVDGPYIESDAQVGRDLAFSYKIKNLNEGHNLPSGSLGAQPQLWVNVALIDPDGKSVWESGYVDSNGDMADLHSLDVAAGTIATDQQLVSFQTKFLTTNVKGTDREMYLPVNFDIDPLPHLRPPQVPTTILNHPPLVRMENHSLPPLAEKVASYEVPGELITKPGKYRVVFRLRSRAEPIYFMRFVGATKEMERRMNERIMDFHAYAVAVDVKR